MTRNLLRRRPRPIQPPSFEIRVLRPGPGVVAQLEVSLLGRIIVDGSQTLTYRNQVLLYAIFTIHSILLFQDITMGEPTYGPDCTFVDPSFGDLEVSKQQDVTELQWETSRHNNAISKASGHRYA